MVKLNGRKGSPRGTGQAGREVQNEERRRGILKALYACIRKKGFTGSSLTDIALEAGMSPSHIRYYFNGKNAILESYLEQTCEQILSQIRAIDTADPLQWFEDFTDFFIGNPWITPARLSVMVEIFGISVHDTELRRIKARYDQEIRDILRQFFERVGCARSLDPAEAAEITQAIESGLKYNIVFKEAFDPAHARRIFIKAVRELTGAPV
ncbi:MAG: TetR/AcrR family transcriptional regulator [Pseudomonadales bacterium]|nr:TetR/AcrR family transcriptional regulator [Pseudomonadales bacterium]